ncbi:MAG: efflux RND transporter permease subunit [Oceanipulchritudo sp.]
MHTFFELCVRRPVMTSMMSLALVIFGVLGLDRLPVRELPDIDAPIVNVLAVYPGASAEVVEAEVTERLEEAVSSASGIRLLTSETREQVSSITIEFEQGEDLDVAAQDVRDRIGRVRGRLPDDVEDPVVFKSDASASPIMWVAFFSDRFDTRELTKIADEQVKDRLQTVPGVSSVIIGGEKRFAMRIWLDSEKMAARGVTVLDVNRALQEQNVELPSGRVENLDRELTIQTKGQLLTEDAFNRLIIREEEDRIVRLADIGYAMEGVEDERAIARFRGKPSVGLGIVRQSTANTLDVAEGVKQRMAQILPQLPEGIEVSYPYDESVYVEKAINEVFETLGIAFVLVVLTIFFFLRNVRSTIIPSLSVPISIIASFGVMYILGFSINIFTLLALVLAIGIVVDDAIVVLENVYRHIEDGMRPFDAAIMTMREIAFAIVTITMSLVAVFLPLAFIGGITGRLLLEFAVALAVAVLCSAFVALTLSPMASARILKPLDQIQHGRVFNAFERFFKWLNRHYEKVLGFALRHRPTVLILAVLSLGLSAFFFLQLDEEFIPQEDKGRFFSIAIAPVGSTPEYTDRMMRQMEAIVAETEEVDGYFTAVALPFNGPGDASQGFMFVRLIEGDRPNARDIVGGPNGLGARFMGEVEGAIAIPILPKAVSVGFGQPFQLVVTNPSLQDLAGFSQQLANRLRQEGFLSNVRSTFEINKPELRIEIDRNRAGTLGVSVEDISRTLQVLFGGQDVSEIKRDGKQYEVIVQLERENRLTPTDLERIFVRNNRGDLVQLNNVISTTSGAGPNVIERFGRQRSATIEGTPVGVTLGTAVERTEAILAEMIPEGYTYDWLGEARNLKESSSSLYFFLLLAIIVVYMVLAAQFESLLHPFTVMLALPLAFLGAFGLLYLLSWVNHFGEQMYAWVHYAPDPPQIAYFLNAVIPRIPSMNINIFSQVGLVLLVGLVTKNSILLVEFANQQMAKGAAPKEAMKKAGLIRLRPILMTSFATIAGILPIAIGFGEAAESRRPLGVVAVGGMITSTILTLVVIPVIYTLLAEFQIKIGMDPRKTAHKETVPE